MEAEILSYLSADYPWKAHLHCFPELDSTTSHLKVMARQGAPHGTVLIADRQTAGHGRLGRSFHSPAASGIYLSFLLRPNCAPQELMHLTCAAGVAMCDAVEKAAGFLPGIKWTNDLVWGKRKLGGILTELGFGADGKVAFAIVGIGINCCQQPGDFPEDIRHIAGSLSMATGRPVNRAAVAAAMMESLFHMSDSLLTGREAILRQYRADCINVGQDISLVRGEEIRYGTALDVDDQGALIVRFQDGHTEAVNSGEVSVRGMYGYI